MKFYVPACGHRIRLTSDWTFMLYAEYRNEKFSKAAAVTLDFSWQKSDKRQMTLPSGTVLEVDRVYIRQQNKSAMSTEDDYDSLTFKLIEHPTMKGRNRFWAKLSDVNRIEFDLPVDNTLVKTELAIKANKPKKLTRDIIEGLLMTGLYYAVHDRSTSEPVQVWVNTELQNTLSTMTKEWARRQMPIDKDVIKEERVNFEKLERDRFDRGYLMIPLNLQDKVKTYEDYVRFCGDYYRPNYRHCRGEKDFIIDGLLRMIFDKYSAKKCSTTRDDQGQITRMYRMSELSKLDPWSKSHMKNCADLSDMWIAVTSNVDDTDIIEVRAGIDSK
jgi:hypothetical protein